MALRKGGTVKNSETKVILSNPDHNYGLDYECLLIFACFIFYIYLQKRLEDEKSEFMTKNNGKS